VKEMVVNQVKKRRMVSVFFVLLLTLLPMSAIWTHAQHSTEITYTVSFDRPIYSTQCIQDTTYDVVSIPETTLSGKTMHPLLPIRPISLVLPLGTQVESYQIQTSSPEVLGVDLFIAPVPSSQPLSSEISSISKINTSIYASNELYPHQIVSYIGTYCCRGYNIAYFTLNPLQYRPASGTLTYYSSMSLQITLEDEVGDKSLELYRSMPEDVTWVTSYCDNAEEIMFERDSNVLQVTKEDGYDLLILTTEELSPAFQLLKQAHDAEGLKTQITTLSMLGDDSPETIRSYIKDQYLQAGISSVLLGGDDTVVPAQMFWVEGLDEGVELYETQMPSDVFYGCLDGTFNGDGDEKWGEATDGINGGDVDLLAEVAVGRACVDTLTEAYWFVNKTIAYSESLNDLITPNYLFVGEHLGNFGVASWGGNYLDQLINGSNDDGYQTVGVPADSTMIETLYERDDNWEKTDLITVVNQGVHVINHDGHSNYNYNMKCTPNDLEQFTNTKYCFVYSQGCNAGGFDNRDCFAEYMTVKSEHAAVAGIWNARYGWFWSFRTDGDSQRFHREFWDAVYAEDIYSFGAANMDSKADNIFLINRSCIRWCYYQLNLFGDPTLTFFATRPVQPTISDGPKNGKPGVEYFFESDSTSPLDLDLYYYWDWGDGTQSGWIGPFHSGDTCNMSHQWAEKGSFPVRVKVKDQHGRESGWSDEFMVSMPKYRSVNEFFKNMYHDHLRTFSLFFTYLLKI